MRQVAGWTLGARRRSEWRRTSRRCPRAGGMPRWSAAGPWGCQERGPGGLAHEDAEEHGVRQDHGAVDVRSMSRLKATMTTWEEPRFLGLSAWR